MHSRSEELRRRSRRIFRWSFALAVLLHLVAFVFLPRLERTGGTAGGTELLGGGATDWTGVPMDVFFGPPSLQTGDSLVRQPDGRFLRANRRVPPPPGCARTDWAAWEVARGEVRLLVNERGRVESVEVIRSTAERCWDGIMTAVAGDLLYRWLPNDSVPAPVEVHQPVTLSPAR